MVNRTIIYAIFAAVIIAIASSVGTWYLTQPAPAAKMDKVLFQLSWFPSGNHAPYYVALDQGYFEDNNIIVTIIRGYGSGDTITKVDQGKADFGEADIGSLTVLRGQGAKVKAVGVHLHVSSMAIITLEGSGITQPSDLEGKKVAFAAWGHARTLWPAYCQKAGIDINSVEIVTIDPALKLAALLSGQVDAAEAFVPDIPGHELTAAEQGMKIVTLLYSDVGINMYGAGIISSEATIEENPDLVRRFVDAAYKGHQFAIDNPEEAINIMLKYNPELKKELELPKLRAAISLMEPVISAGKTNKALGIMDPEIIESTRDLIVEYMGLETDIPIDDIYTNEFVET